MKTENQKMSNVVIPAGTASLLKEMFTSHNGVDMSAIINDLDTNDNSTVVTINLGLLLNGKILKVTMLRDLFGLLSLQLKGNRLIRNLMKCISTSFQ